MKISILLGWKDASGNEMSERRGVKNYVVFLKSGETPDKIRRRWEWPHTEDGRG